jgi:hypothetical protein
VFRYWALRVVQPSWPLPNSFDLTSAQAAAQLVRNNDFVAASHAASKSHETSSHSSKVFWAGVHVGDARIEKRSWLQRAAPVNAMAGAWVLQAMVPHITRLPVPSRRTLTTLLEGG